MRWLTIECGMTHVYGTLGIHTQHNPSTRDKTHSDAYMSQTHTITHTYPHNPTHTHADSPSHAHALTHTHNYTHSKIEHSGYRLPGV